MKLLTKVFFAALFVFSVSWSFFFLLPTLEYEKHPERVVVARKSVQQERNENYYYLRDPTYPEADSSDLSISIDILLGDLFEEELDEGLIDLRGGNCIKGGDESIRCYDEQNHACPDYVTPLWLHAAPRQYACSTEGYYCTIACTDDQVYWYAHSCVPEDSCPPYEKTPWQNFFEFNPEADAMARMGLLEPKRLPQSYSYEVDAPAPFYEQPTPQNRKTFTEAEKRFSNELKQSYTAKQKKFLQTHGFDLRGAECEIKDGQEICFVAHRGGRDICPSYVNSLYLSLAEDYRSCDSPGAYCTVTCQDKADKVGWNIRTLDWCAIQEDPGACKPIPPKIAFEKFYLQEWKEPTRPVQPCHIMTAQQVDKLKQQLKPITVGVLTRGRELPVLRNSMDTWVEGGFIEAVSEFIIMVNENTEEMTQYLAKYQQAPYNIKVMVNPTNLGISKALNWLMGNATSDYFLFMEKDFRQVEPEACVVQQLSVGVDLLESETADMVKFRSRYNAGKPNYAEIIYKTREDAVFRIQPNLLCNFYHWIDEPHQRWPNHFEICHSHPLFYCVKSQFCNWTNNPILIKTQWWFSNFVEAFDALVDPEPSFNLEGFMNGVGEAWNDRGYIVAEGEGMFKHCDVNNMG